LLGELEAARAKATDLNQLSAAVKAISEKAKISGLLVQKVEVTQKDEYEGIESVEELLEVAADEFAGDNPQKRKRVKQFFREIVEMEPSPPSNRVIEGSPVSQRMKEINPRLSGGQRRLPPAR
jgi:hypothetical protein